MNFIKKNWRVALVILYFLVIPLQMLIADNEALPRSGDGKLINPLEKSGVDSIPKFIKLLLEGAIKIGIPIIALAIIYCGFLFVAARGNSEKINTAKDALLYTLIGAAILLGSLALAELISATITSLG